MKILLEGKCNNRCVFCDIFKTKKTSFLRIEKKISSFNHKKDNRIIFTGVEPLLRDDIFDILRLAKKKGIEIIQLNTNGRLLSQKMFAREIIKSGANYFKISLHGHNPESHDNITQSRSSFRETIRGIKNLVELEQKDNIVISIVLNGLNYKNLPEIFKIIKSFGIRKVQVNVAGTSKKDLVVPLEILAKQVSKIRYQFFFDVLLKVKNIPYCLMPEPESMFLRNKDTNNFSYLIQCEDCKYKTVCSGIGKNYLKSIDISKIKPISDLPEEIMIEVESRCNFNCKFCFNKASFAEKGYRIDNLKSSYIRKIIDNAKKVGVKIIRFTGGEPMLRPDLFKLIKYAKSKKLEVRLNTNGSLISKYSTVKEMAKYLDYVLFSMHTHDPKEDEKITGVKGSFVKKIRAIRWFKKAGIKTIRINTVATLKNIRNLEKMYRLMKDLGINKWAVNRLIPVPGEENLWGEKENFLLIDKLVKIKKDKMKSNNPIKIHIANAIPLCAGDLVEMNAICSGGRSVDGHERFAVDPRGFAKPIYYIEKNIGDPTDIMSCWNHSFMKKMRNYNILPKECKKCFFVDKCKGGNRYAAYAAFGSYRAKDYLMDYSKIKNYVW